MSEIIEYRCVFNHFTSGLSEDVNEYIKDGWVPLGGPQSVLGGEDSRRASGLIQAMVKYAPAIPSGTNTEEGDVDA